jgi:multisubunit Na+/H+ antiporter MnhF subunit
MLNVTLAIALTMLALGAALAFVRLMRGPTMPDRVISIDLIGILIVCVLVVVG